MNTHWQEILDGESHPSNIIKEEILNLTNNGKELESRLVELEATLQGLQKDLLAGLPNALEAVRATEANISESRNKLAAISGVIRELEEKLTEALASEKTTRQEEIIREVGLIDGQMAEIRLEIVEHFSRAVSLYANVTGSEPSRLSYDFFLNYRLDDELRRRISEGSSDEVPLHRQREALQSESIRLGKQKP